MALVWLLNLYNFMDGIDGIAAAEAVCVCSGGAILYLLTGRPEAGYAPLLLAAAAAGFLCWNFPPAKIFMGDVGSGFLGITLGVLALQAGWTAPQLTWSWLILLVPLLWMPRGLCCAGWRGESVCTRRTAAMRISARPARPGRTCRLRWR
ncbi:hypothetical protein WJ973_05405 [Achromobacter xylosoxidans]